MKVKQFFSLFEEFHSLIVYKNCIKQNIKKWSTDYRENDYEDLKKSLKKY